jgi:hypothetical protein
VEAYGIGNVVGLAVVERLERGELVPVLLNEVGQAAKQVGAIVAGGLRPRALVERVTGCREGGGALI